MTKSYYFSLPEISCPSCVGKVEAQVRDLHGVVNHKVYLSEKLLRVDAEDVTDESIVRKKIHDALDEIYVKYIDGDAPKRWYRNHWLLGGVGVTFGAIFLVLPLIFASLPLALSISIAVTSVLLTLGLGATSYKKAAELFFKSGKFDMDSLFAISTATVIIVSITSFFIPWLPMMFEAGLLIFGFRHLGVAIRDKISQSTGVYRSLSSELPKEVKLHPSDELRSLNDIKLGDIIEIMPGQMIPFDGICETDGCIVNVEAVWGRTDDEVFLNGLPVSSGMILNENSGPMSLRVSKLLDESYISIYDSKIDEARKNKSDVERRADKILQYFVPAIILLATAIGITLSFFFPVAIAISCAVAVLVSACPCTLGMITPLAVRVGMNKAANHGVLFKSAQKMQDSGDIDTVVFDLNGTLTNGTPVVRECGVIDKGFSQSKMLTIMDALEIDSVHSFARAIRDYVKNKPKDETVGIVKDRIKQEVSGVSASVDGKSYLLGDKALMQNNGIETSVVDVQLMLEAGDNVVYLALKKQIIGYLILNDALRDEAKWTIDSLKKMDKKVYICTGSDADTANRFALALDIPEENVLVQHIGVDDKSGRKNKETFIKNLQKEGHKVAMVGDGINDGAAVQCSDFGIAMVHDGGIGAFTADNASAEVRGKSLLPVATVFSIGQQTKSNIEQNLLFSLGYNLLSVLAPTVVFLAVGFVLNPAIGAALMIIQSTLLLANLYRFKVQKLEHLDKPKQVGLTVVPGESYRNINSTISDNKPQVTSKMGSSENVGRDPSPTTSSGLSAAICAPDSEVIKATPR